MTPDDLAALEIAVEKVRSTVRAGELADLIDERGWQSAAMVAAYGRHITDCRTRLYMKSRQNHGPAIAAVKAGFSTVISRHDGLEHGIPCVGVVNVAGTQSHWPDKSARAERIAHTFLRNLLATLTPPIAFRDSPVTRLTFAQE